MSDTRWLLLAFVLSASLVTATIVNVLVKFV